MQQVTLAISAAAAAGIGVEIDLRAQYPAGRGTRKTELQPTRATCRHHRIETPATRQTAGQNCAYQLAKDIVAAYAKPHLRIIIKRTGDCCLGKRAGGEIAVESHQEPHRVVAVSATGHTI